jgi:hypothetical protein
MFKINVLAPVFHVTTNTGLVVLNEQGYLVGEV